MSNMNNEHIPDYCYLRYSVFKYIYILSVVQSAKAVIWTYICLLSRGTLIASYGRDIAATADPYLSHAIGPITGYGVNINDL